MGIQTALFKLDPKEVFSQYGGPRECCKGINNIEIKTNVGYFEIICKQNY